MLSSAENQAFNKALGQRLFSEPDATAEAIADPKAIFCQYWSYCKMALQAISDLVGNIIVKAAVKTIIAAGDILQGQICK